MLRYGNDTLPTGAITVEKAAHIGFERNEFSKLGIVALKMVGGVQGFTFGRVIWSQFGMAFDWPFGAAMSTVLLFLSLIVIGIAGKIVKKAENV